MLDTINRDQSPRLIVCSFPLALARIRSVSAAPATRKPTRVIAGMARRAILPTMGQVANRICTAIKARCGATAFLDPELGTMVRPDFGHKKDRESSRSGTHGEV